MAETIASRIGDQLKDSLRVNRATTGFFNIAREAISPAAMFGSKSLSGRILSSRQTQQKVAQTERQISSGYKELEQTTQDVQDNTPTTPGGQVESENIERIKEDLQQDSDTITQSQGEEIIKELGTISARINNLAGQSGGLFSLFSGLLGAGAGLAGGAAKGIGGAAKGVGGAAKRVGGAAKSAGSRVLEGGKNALSNASVKTQEASKQAIDKVKKRVQTRVAQRVAGSIATKAAVRGGLALTGVGAIASAGLLAYDAYDLFSQGSKDTRTFLNPMSTEAEKEEAFNRLLRDNPERLGVPESINPDDRMAFMTAQESNPSITAEDFNEMKSDETAMNALSPFQNTEAGKAIIEKRTRGEAVTQTDIRNLEEETGQDLDLAQTNAIVSGVDSETLNQLRQNVTEATSGVNLRTSSDLEEANRQITEAGLAGDVFARQTDTGIEIETATERAMRMEEEKPPVVVQAPAPPPVQMKQGDIIVNLPKTILSLNESARRFVAIRQ